MTWNFNRSVGVLVSLLCATVWFVVDKKSGSIIPIRGFITGMRGKAGLFPDVLGIAFKGSGTTSKIDGRGEAAERAVAHVCLL